jgi:hypothetical protein
VKLDSFERGCLVGSVQSRASEKALRVRQSRRSNRLAPFTSLNMRSLTFTFNKTSLRDIFPY